MTYKYLFISGIVLSPPLKSYENEYYVTYNNQIYNVDYNIHTYKIEVTNNQEYSPDIVKYINDLLDQNQISVYGSINLSSSDKNIQRIWKNIMIDTDTHTEVAMYHGYIAQDSHQRLYSLYSYIMINKNYRGKGLCTNFAKDTYNQIHTQLQVKYFLIVIQSENIQKACSCYIQAGISLQYNVYIQINENEFMKVSNKQICEEIVNTNIVKIIFVVDGQLDDMMKSNF